MGKKLLCQVHPVFYHLSVAEKRVLRCMSWLVDEHSYASTLSYDLLTHRVKKHQSVLIRKLLDPEDMWMQRNKVENLRIAIPLISSMLIRPGETFSFCRTVGVPTRRRGFVEGMELSRGKVQPGVGGGLCQISNLIHWLVMHTPLTIVERHHHSFDPFPDSKRVLPFGSGATVFFNYKDYRFRNDTQDTYQLNLWFNRKCLEGEIRCDEESPYAYHVYERNHIFLRRGEKYFRKNEIWRKKIAKFESGKVLEHQFLMKNFAEVKYKPEDVEIEEDAPKPAIVAEKR